MVIQMTNLKLLLMLVGLVVTATYAANAQDIAGDWQGTLLADGVELRLVLHITKNDDGTLKATLDSVDSTGRQRNPSKFNLTEGFKT